jgi:hypothetical protein
MFLFMILPTLDPSLKATKNPIQGRRIMIRKNAIRKARHAKNRRAEAYLAGTL